MNDQVSALFAICGALIMYGQLILLVRARRDVREKTARLIRLQGGQAKVVVPSIRLRLRLEGVSDGLIMEANALQLHRIARWGSACAIGEWHTLERIIPGIPPGFSDRLHQLEQRTLLIEVSPVYASYDQEERECQTSET